MPAGGGRLRVRLTGPGFWPEGVDAMRLMAAISVTAVSGRAPGRLSTGRSMAAGAGPVEVVE